MVWLKKIDKEIENRVRECEQKIDEIENPHKKAYRMLKAAIDAEDNYGFAMMHKLSLYSKMVEYLKTMLEHYEGKLKEEREHIEEYAKARAGTIIHKGDEEK